MRTVSPPSIAVAMPTPAKPTPSVVMKEGVLSFTCSDAVEEAHDAAGDDGERHRAAARSHKAVMSLATRRLAITAVRATMPSTERSMLPMRMMKVAPMHSTSGMAAELSRRMKLPRVRKLALNRLMRMQSASSTATGAHLPPVRQTEMRCRCIA